MRGLLRWLIWMFLAQQVYSSIEKYPEIWTDPVFWATVVVILLILGAIQFKIVQSSLEAKYSGENATLKGQIALLKQKLESEDPSHKSILKSLKENDIKALEAIERFERAVPRVEGETPSHYGVNQLETELNIHWWEANEIIKKLKKLDLVYCLWENEAVFVNIDRPIGEEKPVILRGEGRDILALHRMSKK